MSKRNPSQGQGLRKLRRNISLDPTPARAVCYVVVGYGVKGTNDKSSPMPPIHKPPISLSLPELAAVIPGCGSAKGRDAPTYEEIIKSYESLFPKLTGLNSRKISRQVSKRALGGWDRDG